MSVITLGQLRLIETGGGVCPNGDGRTGKADLCQERQSGATFGDRARDYIGRGRDQREVLGGDGIGGDGHPTYRNRQVAVGRSRNGIGICQQSAGVITAGIGIGGEIMSLVIAGGYRSPCDGCSTINCGYVSIQRTNATADQATAHVSIGGNGGFNKIRKIRRVGMGGGITRLMVIRVEIIFPFYTEDGGIAIIQE